MSSILGRVEVNPVMTKSASKLGGGGSIWDQLFPNVLGEVAESAGRLLDVDTTQESQRIDELVVAPGATPVRFVVTLSDSKTYRTVDRTLDFPLPDKIRDTYKNVADVEAIGGIIARDKIELVRENLVATAVTTAGSYAAANKATLAGGDQWSDYANSKPLENIMTAIEAVLSSCGYRPNVFWCGQEVWTKLSQHPDIVGMLGANQIKFVTPEAFAALFQFQKVAVGEKIYVSSKRGQTVTRAFLWGKFAGMAYVDFNPNLMLPTFGLRIPYRETQAGIFRDENVKSDIIRVGEDADYVLREAACGYLWSAAVA